MRLFLMGYARISFAVGDMAEVLNLCMLHRLRYSHYKIGKDETICFEMSMGRAWFLLRACGRAHISPLYVKWLGLPHLLWLYRKRAGLLIGGVLGVLLFVLSGRVLWDIRVEGNDALTKRQVLEELKQGGMHVGMLLPGWDRHETEMRILLETDRLSWVSVNMVGTVAYVEVRERVPVPEKEKTPAPANVVAVAEGIVERVEVYTGWAQVSAGQRVGAGELLISGVFDSQAQGYRVTRAAGRVFARTVREFCIEIPFEAEKKVYTGERKTQRTLFFFGKEIKLFKNSGIDGYSCDKIDTVEDFTLREGVTLPISFHKDTYLPYETVRERRDADTVRVLAYEALRRKIETELPEAELLKKTIRTEMDDGVFRLVCTLTCLEDIGKVQEFSVDYGAAGAEP